MDVVRGSVEEAVPRGACDRDDVLKSLVKSLVWLLRYLLGGLMAFGLGMQATRMPDEEDGSSERCGREETVAPDPLSHDERLWEAELTADDAGTL